MSHALGASHNDIFVILWYSVDVEVDQGSQCTLCFALIRLGKLAWRPTRYTNRTCVVTEVTRSVLVVRCASTWGRPGRVQMYVVYLIQTVSPGLGSTTDPAYPVKTNFPTSSLHSLVKGLAISIMSSWVFPSLSCCQGSSDLHHVFLGLSFTLLSKVYRPPSCLHGSLLHAPVVKGLAISIMSSWVSFTLLSRV